MHLSHETDPELQAAYNAAVDRLPVLSRVLLQMHRVENLPYSEIARRLSLDYVAVAACFAEALAMIAAMLDGEQPKRLQRTQIEPAETMLHQRHRAYCEDRLRAMGIVRRVAWRRWADDDVVVTESIVQAMPRRTFDTARLFFGDGMTIAQIAARMGTFPWLVRNRVSQVMTGSHNGPDLFETWLKKLGGIDARVPLDAPEGNCGQDG